MSNDHANYPFMLDVNQGNDTHMLDVIYVTGMHTIDLKCMISLNH